MPTPTPHRTTVLLRHETGSPESVHYDWMVEIGPGEPLLSWRIGKHLDDIEVGGEASIERIQDHDPKWLHLEGPTPLSKDRGIVSPCTTGEVVSLITAKAWLLRVVWANGILASYRLERPDSADGTLRRL